ncbi:hypothetical protein D9758_016595 [Tetrapyrgos nigripes]|uniref:Uncharacterized protein n=1 Tax=Tetrapyrgos nigripes TaxID=182062 RepID=A0A8H5FL55_9AGAR|nr:hypothetical protein D9758_016595 [Tetrapyrgos nigripes]
MIRIPSHINPTPVSTQTVLLALEAALVKRLGILNRRTCETYINRELGKSSLASSLRSENPTRYLVTHGIIWDGDAERENVAGEWVETSVTELKKTEGWVRTRTFRVIDSLKMRLGVPEGPEPQKVHIYFAGLELLTPEGAESYTQHVGHFYLFT